MKYWTSVSPTNEDYRWQTLADFLTQAGVANTFESGNQEFNGLDALEKFHHVRVGNRFGAQLLQSLKIQSSWVRTLGVIDGLVKNDQGWWPLCAQFESFRTLIFNLGHEIDNRGSVLVAGAGGTARVAIAAFFKSGFQNFLLTSFDEAEAQTFREELQARFFGLTLQWVPMQKIVLLPGESSVLVNCTAGSGENALLTELSYMNFLKRPGFLFDINRHREPSVLVQEAQDAGENIVKGLKIAALSDVTWAKWAFGVDLPLDEYRAALESATPV